MASVDDLEFVEIAVGGHYYEVKAKDTTISGELVIPDTYNGLPVSGLRSSAFEGCVNLTAVTVPASIGLVGLSAFSGCTGLTTVTLLSSDLYLGYAAFKDCTSLTTLNISAAHPSLSETVQGGGGYVFANCTSLTSIDLSLFSFNSFYVPAGCFKGCTGLTGIALPSNTTRIDKSAFEGCTGITSITIPDTVTTIGARAFAGCSGLTEFKFEGSAIEAADEVLSDTTALASISAPENAGWGSTWGGKTVVTESGGHVPTDGLSFELIDEGKSYSVGAVSSSAVFGDVEIPSEHEGLPVSAIRDYAFSGCKYVTSISIPESVTSIGAYAFSGCSDLVSAPLPASVSSIGNCAFLNCTSLLEVSIPEAVTSVTDNKNNIGYAAFNGCTSLKSVVFSSSFVCNGNSGLYLIFEDCPSISSITVTAGAATNCNAEGNCLFVASSFYPDDTSTLSWGCKDSVIPRGTAYISAHAFHGCTGLVSISIPDTVVGIYTSAFHGCTGLAYFKFDGDYVSENTDVLTDTPLLAAVFVRDDAYGWTSTWNGKPVEADVSASFVFELNDDGVSYSVAANRDANLEDVVIPGVYKTLPVTAISDNGFSGIGTIYSVYIGSSITHIGDGAFSGCSGLQKVYFEGDAIEESEGVFNDTPLLRRVYVYTGTSGWGSTWGGKTVVVTSTEKTNFRVIPMQCGNDESYALVFYEQEEVVKVDVYDATTKEKVASLDSPFPVGGISDIRYVQSYDVLFFAQPDTYPCKFKRENDEDSGVYKFSFEDSEFLPEPIMEWNDNDEHVISVSAIPDEDLLVENELGDKVFPKGVIRGLIKNEDLDFGYSHTTVSTSRPKLTRRKLSYNRYYDYYISGTHSVTIRVFVSATPKNNYVNYEDGTSVRFSTPVVVNYVVWAGPNTSVKASEIDGAAAEKTSSQVSFSYGVVEGRSQSGELYLFVGTIYAESVRDRVKKGDEGSFVHTVSAESSGFGNISYGDSQFYTTLEETPVNIAITDTRYYSPVIQKDAECAVLIDGMTTNKNIEFGQIIALKMNRKVYKSAMWDYDDIPVGTKPNPVPSPPVKTLEKLASKKDDADGTELRPETGGGFGFASEWIPVRGEVTFKTDGVWSGVLELQEIDCEDHLNTIATITSENGLSNTELERDVTDFGRCVRVACTRREMAYNTNRSVSGDGKVYTKTIISDEGCQWTLTAEDDVAFLRITGTRVLSNGSSVYTAKIVGGLNGPGFTNSYALGAWSTKNGYPRHITIFQERLVYAGNKEKPMTVWMSKTNKWKDFELGTDDTSAITATLATEKYDSIEWLTLNKNSILLGSKYNEFSIGANDGTVTTADNILASTMSSIGGAAIPAAKVGTSTLMVKVGREELHKVEFNALSEQSTGTQVSMLARHLFEGDRIKDVFSIQSPRNMLFCVHESGKLSSLTYEQEFDVLGFARHDVLDGVESGCVIRRGGRDVLCMVVREGNSYVLGEIDFDSDVWTDDGKNYESEVLTTPLKPQSKYATSGYGRQANIAGADVYVSSDSRQFRARLVGSDAVDIDWVRVDNGFNTDGELRGWDRQKVELPATGSWLEEPMVEIKCDTAHPLTVYGIGAAIAQGN